MIDFNKTSLPIKTRASTHQAIKKRRPKVQLTKQNKQFLQSIGLIK